MALAVPKERGKPGQLSDLPENSPRHTARFTVPRNDKKTELWGAKNRRPPLSAYGPFLPSRGATLPAPLATQPRAGSPGRALPQKKPVRHRLGKAALSQICAFFAESTVCLCSPQRRALGG